MSELVRLRGKIYFTNCTLCTGVGASYWVGRLPDEGDVQIEWMTGVLCNGLICQQVSSKKELNILPSVLAKDTFLVINMRPTACG